MRNNLGSILPRPIARHSRLLVWLLAWLLFALTLLPTPARAQIIDYDDVDVYPDISENGDNIETDVPLQPGDAALSGIVIEPVTGTVLWEKNPDLRHLVASTTKIMTALIVLEHCALDETMVATQEQHETEGSSMFLEPGDTYTVEQVLYGLLLQSGNDAAVCLAEHVAGSVEAFADLMNAKCQELGLQNTHFVNPHGLDAEEHYSTARDLATITAAAMKNETFCTIFGTWIYELGDLEYVNHCRLISWDERCTGGKTGYTEAAGRILVSTARDHDMDIICVTIDDPDDWKDHRGLYDQVFSEYQFAPTIPEDYRLPVVSGFREDVPLTVACHGFVVPASSTLEVRVYLPGFVFAPVQQGEQAGVVHVTIDGELQRIPICYAKSVFIDGTVPLRPWENFVRAWRQRSSFGVYYGTTAT